MCRPNSTVSATRRNGVPPIRSIAGSQIMDIRSWPRPPGGAIRRLRTAKSTRLVFDGFRGHPRWHRSPIHGGVPGLTSSEIETEQRYLTTLYARLDGLRDQAATHLADSADPD